MKRHGTVYLPRKFNKSGLEPHRTSLPGQVVGVDGDAVSSQPWTGVKGHETERFGGSALNDLPDIYLQPVAHEGQLVDEGYVYAPEGVLVDLDHLGNRS